MTESETISVSDLGADVIRAMIHGDRALRNIRVPTLGAQGGMPGVLISRSMRAHIQLTLFNGEKDGFLPRLRLIGDDSPADVLANVRVNFELRPSPAPTASRSPAKRIALLVPPFIHYDAQADYVVFALSAKESVQVTFTRRNQLRLRDQAGRTIPVSKGWPVAWLAAVLNRIARWLREGETGRLARSTWIRKARSASSCGT